MSRLSNYYLNQYRDTLTPTQSIVAVRQAETIRIRSMRHLALRRAFANPGAHHIWFALPMQIMRVTAAALRHCFRATLFVVTAIVYLFVLLFSIAEFAHRRLLFLYLATETYPRQALRFRAISIYQSSQLICPPALLLKPLFPRLAHCVR